MKISKLFLLSSFLVFLFILASCVNGTYESELSESITFSSADPISQMRGYVMEARIENRRYIFAADDRSFNLSFINYAESVIYELSNISALLEFPFTIRIFAFDHEDISTYGKFVNTLIGLSSLNGSRLPAWLSSGIESVARRNAGLNNLLQDDFSINNISENFGDFYFIPRFLGSGEQANAINTSYHFVKYLIENELLDELLELYMSTNIILRSRNRSVSNILEINNNIIAANELAEKHFYSFAGKTMEAGFIFELRDGSVGYYLRKPTKWGNFIFVFDSSHQFLPIENMQLQIDYIERATQLVAGWYYNYFEFEFRPINHRIYPHMFAGRAEWAALAFPWHNTISYARLNLHFPHIAHHEISHILEYQLGRTPFLPFSEGLAYFLQYYFSDANLELLGLTRHDHTNAHAMFVSGDYRRISDISANYNANHASYIPELSARTTATSFVQYLIETYGAEKYFQVHWNIRNFETVYGITLDEMILQWREFLVEYVASNQGA